jgi:hypothetical protein
MPSGFRLSIFVCLVGCLLPFGARLHAQGGSTKTALTGSVVDSGGGVIPGATVLVTSNETGVSFNTVTNADGAFSVPSLDAGTYTVTVSLEGFKTSVIKDQRLVAASPANVNVTIEVGSLSETVDVRAGSELVQTQSGAVSATLMTEQLKTVPLPTRNALYAVNMLPGVDTTGTVRESTIAGLPEQTINITLDGVNVNNNQDKANDGFYAMVRPQLDAIEQVTLTTAAQGADSAGQGAVQIRFVTRSGTNTYRGTMYDYFRHPSLNTNSWINEKNNLPKNEIILHQAGFSQGGPIRIPGLFDGRGKAFFFFNYERFYQPTEATRTRTILNPSAQQGVFRYNVTEGGQTVTRSVNLLQLAQRSNQLSSLDPTLAALLGEIRTAAQTTGTISTQPGATNTETYVFLSPGKGLEHLPTTRVDFNLGPKHRLSGTYYWQQVNRLPDIQNNGDSAFPGLPSRINYLSTRTTGSATLRSTLSPNIVNELVSGFQSSPGYFASGLNAGQYENQSGFSLNLPLSLTHATTPYGGNQNNVTGEDPRNTPNWNIDNTVSWQTGKHSLSFGGSMSQFSYEQTVFNSVPTVGFGVQAGLDPADAMFTPANFEGASTGNLNDARALYALLTGRVTSINALARLNENNEYVYLGRSSDRLRLNEFGVFLQDSWRVTSSLTLNGGLRWEVQSPVVALNSNYSTASVADICGPSGFGNGPGDRPCNLFQPGVFNAPGMAPQYVQYAANEPGFKTDWNNVAPNVSAAWRPNVDGGFLRTILGDPDQATIRAGFSIAYNRNGMGEFQTIFGGNPGRSVNANRTNAIGNLVPAGGAWPVLLRDRSRLGPPATCTSSNETGCIPQTVTYPLAATLNNNISIFDPDIQLSYTKSYQIGFQRALTRDMAIEVRYVGNQNEDGWTTENWNERNIYENGFLDEFKRAQTNLISHVAAGCGAAANPCSFGYRGPGTGTSPLPIYLAHFTGMNPGNAGNPAHYSNANFTNTTFVGRLNRYEPSVTNGGNAGDAVNDLFSSATFRTNMLAAGLPANFWVVNPLIGDANVRTSGASTKYHSVQTELRRRLSHGFLINGSYTWARRYTSNLDSLHFPRYLSRATNVPHSFKVNAYYEAPFGRGKRFGATINPWLDGVIGGWTASMTGRMQVQTLSIDNATLVGMSLDELQREYKIRIDADKVVRMMPDDIILNTQRAFSTNATSVTGYSGLGVPEGRYLAPASSPGCVRVHPGDCGEPQNIFLTAPLFTRFDLSLKKQFPLGGRRSFDLVFDVNNVFNNINFTPVFSNNNLNSTTVFQTNAHYTDISQSYDPGGRLGQIIVRVNW